MFVVGVTGGIGSGKSAVTRRFAQHGIHIVDADQVSRTVVEPGTQALQAIAEHFGAAILQADGTLNRAQLRQRIFSDAAEKHWLEALLHPLIGQQIAQELLSAQSPYAILVSPLLIEAGQHTFCNHTLVVDAPQDVQIQRTIARDNNDEAQIRRIIASQMPREQRLENADDVIENTAGLPELEQRVDELHQKYLAMASTPVKQQPLTSDNL